IVADDDVAPVDLHAARIEDDTIVRVNEQGDIEVRRAAEWDIVGGLLGDYGARLHAATGLDWA
ncbi:MAG: hypothetical protein KDA41_02230, partial [Planctomycetales bacterium]|nr:hypothetical protein [Planctomycetales bacterium]